MPYGAYWDVQGVFPGLRPGVSSVAPLAYKWILGGLFSTSSVIFD